MDASRTDYRRCASAVHGAKPIRVIESESVLNILSFDQRLAAEVGVLRAWTAIVRPIAPHTIFNILGVSTLRRAPYRSGLVRTEDVSARTVRVTEVGLLAPKLYCARRMGQEVTYKGHEITADPKELRGGYWQVEYRLLVNFGDRSEAWEVFTDAVKPTKEEAIHAALESARRKIDRLDCPVAVENQGAPDECNRPPVNAD